MDNINLFSYLCTILDISIEIRFLISEKCQVYYNPGKGGG